MIQKDSDTFGNQPSKHLSIYIALVNDHNNDRLRYVATTNDQTDLLLNQTLTREQGVSYVIHDLIVMRCVLCIVIVRID
jgi:hypothetical protein